ncbi:MAG: hypothetical protein R3F37_08530 [Candidatus Competibacteraceae bacterium]
MAGSDGEGVGKTWTNWSRDHEHIDIKPLYTDEDTDDWNTWAIWRVFRQTAALCGDVCDPALDRAPVRGKVFPPPKREQRLLSAQSGGGTDGFVDRL